MKYNQGHFQNSGRFSSNLICCYIYALMISRVSSMSMDVFIQNSEGYFYSKYCELTFTIISDDFEKLDSAATTVYDTIYITIPTQESNNNIFFKKDYEPPYFHLDDGRIVPLSSTNNCHLNSHASFYCLTIPHSQVYEQFSGLRMRFNQTFQMYRFTLKNIGCPAFESNFYRNAYYMEISLVQREKGVPKIYGTFPIQWSNQILFPYIRDYGIVGSQISRQKLPIQRLQFIDKITNCQTFLQFAFVIDNHKLENSWSDIIITLNTKQQGIIVHKQLNCSYMKHVQGFLSINNSYVDIGCTFDSQNGQITIKNQLFELVEIQGDLFQIDPYLMYDYPNKVPLQGPQKYTIRLPKLQILEPAELECNIRINGKILINGNVSEQIVLYENLHKTKIFFIELSSKQASSIIQQQYYQQCLHEQQEQNSEALPIIEFDRLYNNGHIRIVFILLGFMMLVILRICIRKTITMIENMIYLLMITMDIILRVIIVVILKQNEKISSFQHLLETIILVHTLYSIICSFTYVVYGLKSWKYFTQLRKSELENRGIMLEIHKKQIICIILLFLYNYKFYSVFLSRSRFQSLRTSGKLYRLRNNQLYLKYIIHLIIETIMYLLGAIAIYLYRQDTTLIVSIKIPKYILFTYTLIIGYLMMVQIWNVKCMIQLKKIKGKILKIALQSQCPSSNK